MRAGEAMAAARVVGRRFGCPPWMLLVMLLAGGVVGFVVCVVGDLAERLFGLPKGIAPLLDLALGFAALWYGVLPAYRRWVTGRFRKTLSVRGMPADVPVEVEIGPEGVRQNYGDLVYAARWTRVSDLMRAGEYWVFVALGQPIYVPRRFFATPEAERAFLAAALDHMDEASRARSPQATAFLNKAA